MGGNVGFLLTIDLIFIILLYPILVFDSINKTNPINFMMYIVSLVIFVYAIYSIKEKNINSYNIFLFGFFIVFSAVSLTGARSF